VCFKQQLLSADIVHYLTEPKGCYKHLAHLSEIVFFFFCLVHNWVFLLNFKVQKSLEILHVLKYCFLNRDSETKHAKCGILSIWGTAILVQCNWRMHFVHKQLGGQKWRFLLCSLALGYKSPLLKSTKEENMGFTGWI